MLKFSAFVLLNSNIDKPVFKAHGSSNARTFKNAIRLTIDYVNGNVVNEIKSAIEMENLEKVEVLQEK